MSRDNSIGNHGSDNRIVLSDIKGLTTDNKTIQMYTTYPYTLGYKGGVYVKLEYNGREKISDVELTFKVYRKSGEYKVYERYVYPQVQLPVYDGYVCGVSKDNERIGMKFSADNHYPKANEVKMDTIHCFMDSRELFNCPGGKFHEPQTFTVNYPNGQNWTI
ncbi:MAG: hypothetical protein LBR15_07300 [Methanobrevibacter sp.]|nr:hypothetical protein [Candidatus Methanovirga australis]